MKVEEGKFYFIKQEFFEKVKDELLLKNKGDENKRKIEEIGSYNKFYV